MICVLFLCHCCWGCMVGNASLHQAGVEILELPLHDSIVLWHWCCHCTMATHVFTRQALEILELRDQLQDAQEAISEAHSNSAGLKEHNRQLEAQISRLEQQLSDALRWVPPGPYLDVHTHLSLTACAEEHAQFVQKRLSSALLLQQLAIQS